MARSNRRSQYQTEVQIVSYPQGRGTWKKDYPSHQRERKKIWC
ncbi:hypothetical protein VULLAG_LOCUS2020 [Vulpes lagopus]